MNLLRSASAALDPSRGARPQGRFRTRVGAEIFLAGRAVGSYIDLSLSPLHEPGFVSALNRTARAIVSLYALLCLLAGVCVPALHAADAGSSGQTAVDAAVQAADGARQDGRDDTPAPQPHDHQQCVICHAGQGTAALPELPALELRIRLVEVLHAPRTSPVRAPEPSVSLPPSRAPPRA